MQINISMNLMTMKNLISKILILFVFATFVVSCSISPGMYMDTSSKNGEDFVYIETLDKEIKIEDIVDSQSRDNINGDYRIGNGDQIAITVWGLPDLFPIANINSDLNLRRVDSNGDIYFPYVGIIEAQSKTQNELREDLTLKLSEFFNEPQLDVSIAKFNSQKIYLLGEVTTPQKINITDIPLSLSEALGEAKGLNTNTSKGSEVFVIRNFDGKRPPKIFKANLSTPAGFIAAGNFYLTDNDIIYVNASGTSRWNRVISQFFPFSSFLNSIDNLTNSD